MPLEHLYTQPELLQAIQEYVKNRDDLFTEAEKACQKWKDATGVMFNPEPLSDVIGHRGDTRWTPADRKWLSTNLVLGSYHHGLDAAGRVRVVKHSNEARELFVYRGDLVDVFWDRGTHSRLRRFVYDAGRVVRDYDYYLDPHQYRRTDYHYDGKCCVRTTSAGQFEADDGWEDSGVDPSNRFEYDAAGLLKVFHNSGFGDAEDTLVYLRPGASPLPILAKPRRPVLAYTFEPTDPDDPGYQVYCDAYGLEMTIDRDFSVDVVYLAPEHQVYKVTQETELVDSEPVAAGISDYTDATPLVGLAEDNVKWVLVEPAAGPAAVAAVLKHKLGVLLVVRDPAELSVLNGLPKPPKASRLLVAVRPFGDTDPDEAQALAKDVRGRLKKLGCADARVLTALTEPGDQAIDFYLKPDVDGVLLLNSNFGAAVRLLGLVAIYG